MFLHFQRNKGFNFKEGRTMDQQEDEQGESQVRKRRNEAAVMLAVHARSETEKKPIVLNDKNQPIGPDDDTVGEFNIFLGTLARNPKLAPLNLRSWHKISEGKNNDMWKIVKAKYFVPEECKKWAIGTIGDSWRAYRCKLKRNYYTNPHLQDQQQGGLNDEAEPFL